MPKTASKPIIKFKIVSGSVTPHMKRCWKLWWAARIAECQANLKPESESKRG